MSVHGNFHVWELRGEDAEQLGERVGAPVARAAEDRHFSGCDGEPGDARGTGVFADQAAHERAEFKGGD